MIAVEKGKESENGAQKIISRNRAWKIPKFQ